MKQKSLKTNAILNTLKTVLSLIFSLITFPYVSRILQVENIGIYNFCSSIVSYFVLLAGLGISTYAIREGIQYREDKEQIEKFVSEVFSINILSTVISYACLIITVIVGEQFHNYTLAIAILATEIIFTTIGVSWICNIYEDFLFATIQSIGVQALSLILTLALVKSSDDLYKYIAIIAFSRSASHIINLIYVRIKYCKFKFILHCNLKKHIKPVLVIFSTSVAISIYVGSDIIMLGFMTNDYQVGIYSTAVQIYTIVKNILAAALMVLIPRFTLLLQRGEKKAANELFSHVFNILMILMLPSIVGLYITSCDVVRLVGGENYLGGTNILRLLCIAIFFSLLAYLYTQCILVPNKKEKAVFKATVISAGMNIGLNFILIPLFGINGAAITTIIAEIIVCFMSIHYSKNDIHLNHINHDLVSIIIGCIGIVIVGKACYIVFTGSYLVRLAVTILGSAIVYVAILLVGKNSVMMEVIQKLRKR